MRRVALGISLIALYMVGMAGIVLRLMWVEASGRLTWSHGGAFLLAGVAGVLLFVVPGIRWIRSGYRAPIGNQRDARLSAPALPTAVGGPGAPAEAQTLAQRVRAILEAKDVDALRSVATEGGAELAGLLADTLATSADPQIRGMCLDALGLIGDPAALRTLLRELDRCTGFARTVAALSIANSVANRNRLSEAIPTLTRIVEDRSLGVAVRGQATLALCQFRSSHPEVAALLSRIEEDPEEALEVKVVAGLSGRFRGSKEDRERARELEVAAR